MWGHNIYVKALCIWGALYVSIYVEVQYVCVAQYVHMWGEEGGGGGGTHVLVQMPKV